MGWSRAAAGAGGAGAARLASGWVPQVRGGELSRLPAGSLPTQAAISLAQDPEMYPAVIASAIRPWRASRLLRAAPALVIPFLPASQARASQARGGRCPSGSYPPWAVNAAGTAAFTAASSACARCSKAGISACGAVPSGARPAAAGWSRAASGMPDAAALAELTAGIWITSRPGQGNAGMSQLYDAL